MRTNSEALIAVVAARRDHDLSKGIGVGSILRTDGHSHLETTRYPAGAGFFRLLAAPHVSGGSLPARLARMLRTVARHPWRALRAALVRDWAKATIILVYMRTLEGYLRLVRGRALGTAFRPSLVTALDEGPAPTAFMPEASALADRVARKVDGFAESLVTAWARARTRA